MTARRCPAASRGTTGRRVRGWAWLRTTGPGGGGGLLAWACLL